MPKSEKETVLTSFNDSDKIGLPANFNLLFPVRVLPFTGFKYYRYRSIQQITVV